MARRARRLHRNTKAITPVISTVILTATIVLLVTVALAYTNSSLQMNLAASDYNSSQQLMQSVAKAIDDVAWTVGRTDTITYASRYGNTYFMPSVLNYTVYLKTSGSSSFQFFLTYTVGAIFYQIPTSQYSISNGYYSPILPTSLVTLTLNSSTAPAARVFAIERLPANGSYIRVVTAPEIRSIYSSVSSGSSNVYYIKLYLPILTAGQTPNKTKSVTVAGNALSVLSQNKITAVNVTVSFPKASQGFDNSFFHFPALSQMITPPNGFSDVVVEFYSGSVTTTLGVF